MEAFHEYTIYLLFNTLSSIKDNQEDRYRYACYTNWSIHLYMYFPFKKTQLCGILLGGDAEPTRRINYFSFLLEFHAFHAKITRVAFINTTVLQKR